uniref:CHR910 n=1 Tax=Arundo donax TaxID=35708 RepID=A0A0A9FDB4_ARUDO
MKIKKGYLSSRKHTVEFHHPMRS